MTTPSSPAAHRLVRWSWARTTPLILVVLLVAAAGCSSDDDGGGGSSTSAAPTGCSEAAALKDSVTALTQVSPVNDGLDALKSAAADVKTDLDATVSAVSSELQPSVDEVKIVVRRTGVDAGRHLGRREPRRSRDGGRHGAHAAGDRADRPLVGHRSGLLATRRAV